MGLIICHYCFADSLDGVFRRPVVSDKSLFKLVIYTTLILGSFFTHAEENNTSPINVIFKTEMGLIEVEVYADKAPISSASFLAHVDQGLFAADGGFNRALRKDNNSGTVADMEVLQGGILDSEILLPAIAHESTRQTGLSHINGTLSLARSDIGTASGGVFFICIGDQSSTFDADSEGTKKAEKNYGLNLTQGYAAFGRITKGMDVVRAIHQQKTTHWPGKPNLPQQFIDPPIRFLKAYRK